MASNTDLASVIERLTAFQALRDDGKVNDLSQLTVHDLEKILAAATEDSAIDKLGEFD